MPRALKANKVQGVRKAPAKPRKHCAPVNTSAKRTRPAPTRQVQPVVRFTPSPDRAYSPSDAPEEMETLINEPTVADRSEPTLNAAELVGLVDEVIRKRMAEWQPGPAASEVEPVDKDRKFRPTKELEWRDRRNRLQFQANEDIFSALSRAKRAFQTVDPDNKGFKHLEEAMTELNKRQKLVRFADLEGWPAAEKYQAESLGETEEDQRRMDKAKAAAARENRSKDQQPFRQGGRPGGRFYQPMSYYQPAFSMQTSGFRSSTGPTNAYQKFSHQKGNNSAATSTETRICHGCRLVGHLRRDCPTTSRTSST